MEEEHVADGVVQTEAPSIVWPDDAPLWCIETAQGPVEARSALAVIRDVNKAVREGRLGSFEAIPTGFELLDRRLGGGLRLSELVLLGGGQGVGKTTFALQMARNVAATGQAICLYVCFEHDETNLLERLIAQESIDPEAESVSPGLRVRDIEALVLAAHKRSGADLLEVLTADPRGGQALQRIAGYADKLFLIKGSAVRTTTDALHELIDRHRPEENGRLVLFIDYLQKMPVFPEPAEEAEKVTRVVEALKELALSQGIAVVALTAADKEGLRAKRLRLHHLRGSSALAHEADIILIINDKYRIVTKANIEFNPYKAQAFHEWIVCSVEKNRGGRNQIDVEFRKRFEHCCFYPQGGDVQEQLIEERIYTE